MKTNIRTFNNFSLWLILFISFSAFICDQDTTFKQNNLTEWNVKAMKYYRDFLVTILEWKDAYNSGNAENLKPLFTSVARYVSSQFTHLMTAGWNLLAINNRGETDHFTLGSLNLPAGK